MVGIKSTTPTIAVESGSSEACQKKFTPRTLLLLSPNPPYPFPLIPKEESLRRGWHVPGRPPREKIFSASYLAYVVCPVVLQRGTANELPLTSVPSSPLIFHPHILRRTLYSSPLLSLTPDVLPLTPSSKKPMTGLSCPRAPTTIYIFCFYLKYVLE